MNIFSQIFPMLVRRFLVSSQNIQLVTKWSQTACFLFHILQVDMTEKICIKLSEQRIGLSANLLMERLVWMRHLRTLKESESDYKSELFSVAMSIPNLSMPIKTGPSKYLLSNEDHCWPITGPIDNILSMSSCRWPVVRNNRGKKVIVNLRLTNQRSASSIEPHDNDNGLFAAVLTWYINSDSADNKYTDTRCINTIKYVWT